jgi:hypothetical protein
LFAKASGKVDEFRPFVANSMFDAAEEDWLINK